MTFGFDDYIKQCWPANVPEDCINLNEAEDDCTVQSHLGRDQWCESCDTYERLSAEYYGEDGKP